jgi:hypothetical protein
MNFPANKTFAWFASDVGMVKSEMHGMTTTELITLKK